MYEAIIAFLRRSVMPENKRRSSAPKRKESVRLARDSSFAPRERPAPSQNASAADVRPHSPVVLDDPIMAVKTGPRDSKDAKRHTLLMDRELFTDVASTLRRILQADAVAVVNLDEYQLFVRTNSTDDDRSRSHSDKSTKEDVVADFLMGKPWPARIEPVVNYVPRTNGSGVQLLGTDSDLGQHFHFHQEHSEATLGEFLRKWLHNGHFWLDRKEKGDDVSRRLLSLMPEQCQTMLATALLTHDGKPRFASFVSWNRPPSAFNESNTVALPGASILGGIAMAALAIRKVRSLEQSQISYSNLQAQ